ncbi:MAG: hypothetical protein FWH37_00700 [Candidatus Bathyarchaeota archaeon]|nr:hypothetical protein [Candidatus Termiticorpusculum sp.]
MQSSKNRLDELSNEAKRTTLILEKAERVFIDQLIKDGKETGIKSLISKMLDIYNNLMIYDWHFPGEYYYGISRVAFVNIELINVLIQDTPKEKLCDIGKKMGDILKVSMEATHGFDASKQENWPHVFKRLGVQGFGYFYLKDKYLLIKNPFLNEPLIWEGLIDGLFSVKAKAKTLISPFVFEIKSSELIT